MNKMISIEQISNTELLIFFRETIKSDIEQTVTTIINTYPESQSYLFEIIGVDIDRFIEDGISKNYLLKIDKKHKIIKDLPKLFYFSSCLEDVLLFSRYIGSFNEGYMCLYILKNNSIEFSDEKHVLNLIRENKLLTLEVVSDGDGLKLSSVDDEKLRLIRKMLESTPLN